MKILSFPHKLSKFFALDPRSHEIIVIWFLHTGHTLSTTAATHSHPHLLHFRATLVHRWTGKERPCDDDPHSSGRQAAVWQWIRLRAQVLLASSCRLQVARPGQQQRERVSWLGIPPTGGCSGWGGMSGESWWAGLIRSGSQWLPRHNDGIRHGTDRRTRPRAWWSIGSGGEGCASGERSAQGCRPFPVWLRFLLPVLQKDGKRERRIQLVECLR